MNRVVLMSGEWLDIGLHVFTLGGIPNGVCRDWRRTGGLRAAALTGDPGRECLPFGRGRTFSAFR